MTLAASGNIGKAVEALQNLLANSSTFKTATSSATSAAAKAHIYISEYHPDTFVRPFAVILLNGLSCDMVAAQSYSASGTMTLYLERAISEAYKSSPGEAEIEFLNFLDGIISDCQGLSGTPGYLLTRSWTIAESAQRIDDENIYYCKIDLAWGLAN